MSEQENKSLVSDLNADIKSQQDAIKKSHDLSSQIDALLKEKDALVLKVQSLKARMRELEAEATSREAINSQPLEEDTRLLEDAFSTWRRAASSSSKANMFEKIRSKKLMTTVFTKWKRDLADFKISHIEVLSEVKAIRAQKREREEQQEQDTIRKQEDLDRLRKLVEADDEQPRLPSKSKTQQLQKLQTAADHHSKKLHESIGSVFSAWKAASEPYRREQKTKRDFENKASLRSSFNAFKELSDKLKKAKEAICKQRERKLRSLHREIFAAIKSEAARSTALEQQADGFSLRRQKHYFNQWTAQLQQRQTDRRSEAYLRRRLTKHRIEAVFEGFKRGLEVHRSQQRAVSKALQARAAVFKRRKFEEFRSKAAIVEGLTALLRDRRHQSLRNVLAALSSHRVESQRLNRGFSLLVDLDLRLACTSKRQFLDCFVQTTRRGMQLESVESSQPGSQPLR